MFQPQPTPFAFASFGIDVANAEIPEYAFAPTPAGQFAGGHAGGGVGVAGATNAGVRGGPTAADVFASPIFQSHNNHNSGSSSNTTNNSALLPYNSIPHQHQHNSGSGSQRQHQHHHSRNHNYNHSHNHSNNHHNNSHNNNHNSSNNNNHRQRRRIKMESQSDLARQEAAARDYKPQLQGSLVGEKASSHAITEEYAKADPTYVAKTMALPQTYSHYRPIQGDGNCGWRAIAFAYFETLIRCGDPTLLQSELARLTGLSDYIEKVGGHSPWLFEDMVSETFELLEQIIGAVSSGHNPMDILMAKFNTSDVSQSLVYHQRLLASSWLKGNFTQYAPWIAGDVDSYIQDTIMPVDREIDHICLVLMSDVLLKPANIVLEIAYLDRSQGSEVNVHRMPDEAIGQDPSTLGPIIYLLYRPGHYDILYRDPPVPVPPIPTSPISLQINRAASFTHHHSFQDTMPSATFSTMDLATLAMIPTFDSAGLSPLSSPPAGSSPMTDPYAPSSPSPWIPQHFSESMPPPLPPPQQQAQQPTPTQQPATPLTIHPLRFSKYNFPNLPEMVENNSSYEPAFTTNTFKNSHFNVAHYNNMNFQPEMYRPDSEDEIPGERSRGRKRSSEHCAVTKKESRG